MDNDEMVPDFLDSSHESNSGVETMKMKRFKMNNRIYDKKSEYPDEESAFKAVNVKALWTKTQRTHTEEGLKQYYRCKKVKARGRQCAAGAFLLFDTATETYIWFESQNEHDCDQIRTKRIVSYRQKCDK